MKGKLRDKDKIKTLASQNVLGIKKFVRIGDSFGIIIPRLWLEMNAIEIDGEYYAQLSTDETGLRITLITEDDLKGIHIKEKAQ